jgi:uncharacterized damage-inducible protein DinB
VIAETPERLRTLLEALGDQGLQRSLAPGKWSARQVLCHLADCEIAFAFRLRQALAEEGHMIQPFDQDAWARSYGAYDGREACVVFAALRKWNLRLIESLPPAARSRRLTHPERGEMTFQTVIETMAGHDLNHLGQLERIAAQGR